MIPVPIDTATSVPGSIMYMYYESRDIRDSFGNHFNMSACVRDMLCACMHTHMHTRTRKTYIVHCICTCIYINTGSQVYTVM